MTNEKPKRVRRPAGERARKAITDGHDFGYLRGRGGFFWKPFQALQDKVLRDEVRPARRSVVREEFALTAIAILTGLEPILRDAYEAGAKRVVASVSLPASEVAANIRHVLRARAEKKAKELQAKHVKMGEPLSIPRLASEVCEHLSMAEQGVTLKRATVERWLRQVTPSLKYPANRRRSTVHRMKR